MKSSKINFPPSWKKHIECFDYEQHYGIFGMGCSGRKRDSIRVLLIFKNETSSLQISDPATQQQLLCSFTEQTTCSTPGISSWIALSGWRRGTSQNCRIQILPMNIYTNATICLKRLISPTLNCSLIWKLIQPHNWLSVQITEAKDLNS